MQTEINGLLTFLIAGFACYRITQLFVLDDGPFGLFSKFRQSLELKAKTARDKKAAKSKKIGSWLIFEALVQLFNCPYCLGVWVAVGVGALVLAPTLPGNLILIIFSIAGFQTYLQTRDDNQ